MEVDNPLTTKEAVVSINEDPSTSDISENNPSKRLGHCEVCGFHDAKYTCPKCEVKTCSLRCNKIHKLEIECDGERNRTSFIPLNKFTNFDLSSDYRLLEEISRNVESSKKKFSRRRFIPQWLFKLATAAQTRNTTLKYLPIEFARHKNNTTQYKPKENIILWHIDWVFVNAENLKISEPKVDENLKIGAVLLKYLNKQEDASYQEKLQYYQSADLSGINIYLKAEQKAGKKFYQLDHSKSLRECLRKKLIIEYPTIHVVLRGHESLYNVIDTDDEDESMDVNEGKSGKQVIQKIITDAEDEDSLFHSLKNLLFISEYSDDEQSE